MKEGGGGGGSRGDDGVKLTPLPPGKTTPKKLSLIRVKTDLHRLTTPLIFKKCSRIKIFRCKLRVKSNFTNVN